jgi:hypothetical protein
MTDTDNIRVWRARFYQSDAGRVPLEQWAPTFEGGGWTDGKLRMCINMEDIARPYTLETARAEALRRNTLQIHNARRRVENLEKQLADARAHLARAETMLTDVQ